MEPNNSINHIDDDGDQNLFPIDSTQVITPIDSTQLNPLSESSDVLDRFRPKTYNSSKFSALCSLKKKQGSHDRTNAGKVSNGGCPTYWLCNTAEVKFLDFCQKKKAIPKFTMYQVAVNVYAFSDKYTDIALQACILHGIRITARLRFQFSRETTHHNLKKSLFGSLDKLVAPDRPCLTLGHEYGHIMEHLRVVVGLPLGDPSMKWPTCIIYDFTLGCDATVGYDVTIGCDDTFACDGTLGCDGTLRYDDTLGCNVTFGCDGTLGYDDTSGFDSTLGCDGTFGCDETLEKVLFIGGTTQWYHKDVPCIGGAAI
ncbi:unnamed protein product [Lactuca saligna]|uniref:Uncharacterized protein n=1 Tax=Lactuca saligna TaxID=75948 RepID=A0AA35Y4U0_LACSI|nr:unnamed protein product [Lactuca saligna]